MAYSESNSKEVRVSIPIQVSLRLSSTTHAQGIRYNFFSDAFRTLMFWFKSFFRYSWPSSKPCSCQITNLSAYFPCSLIVSSVHIILLIQSCFHLSVFKYLPVPFKAQIKHPKFPYLLWPVMNLFFNIIFLTFNFCFTNVMYFFLNLSLPFHSVREGNKNIFVQHSTDMFSCTLSGNSANVCLLLWLWCSQRL